MNQFGLDLGMGACKLFGAGGGIHPLKITVGSHSFYVGDGAHEWGRPIPVTDRIRNQPPQPQRRPFPPPVKGVQG